MKETGPSSPGVHAATAEPPISERRTFLTWAVNGLGLLFAAVLGIPAVFYLIDPLNRRSPPKGWRTVGRLSELEVNKPVQAVIRDIRHDAWTLHPNDVVGRVWLVKRDNKTVDVYTTVCPHLGCSINFDASSQRFICPCHNGTFDLQCRKVEFAEGNNPPPRDMDKLVSQFDPKDPDVLQVKYENFMQGEAKKEVKA
jgi:menaquinol-cytochrome c reductase iron-sulfur subunit